MSVNKVILVGRLGRDPEVRYMPNGEAVCNFSIATDESWTDKQTGQKVSKTEWHNITLYRRTAEVAGQYLKKGSLVYIEGKIQSRKYTGKDGIERTAYDIIGNEMRMLGGKNDNGGGGSAPYDGGQSYGAPAAAAPAATAYAPPPPPTSYEAPAAPQQRPAVSAPPPVEDIDDDIPF